MTTTCVIASYKYGHLVAHAVESALSQTVPFDEVVVIDDAVGDCRHIEDLFPEVTFIEREENLGTVENFQQALMDVDTDRVMFLGADNWLRPDTLERLSEFNDDIISYDIALTGTEQHKFAQHARALFHQDKGYYIWTFVQGDINKANYIHGSSLYNVKKAQKVGYKASGRANTEEDWMLFKGMLENGATHRHIAEPFLYYRRHRENFNQI